MSKIIGSYKAKLIECPDKWVKHKHHCGTLIILESENKAPGKVFFYYQYDVDFFNYGYLKCSPGEIVIDEKSLDFYTGSGNHYSFMII